MTQATFESMPALEFQWIALLLGVLVFCLGVEAYLHYRRRKSISIRVHVNGTRGKSSVARLIAAGLRGGGIRTSAKTTGTLARFIEPDGSEYPVVRLGKANILEQLGVFKRASRLKSEALVIECMALQPLLQATCELDIVQATHGVLTNAREDHLDIMGPKERDVALALAGSVPKGAKYFTSEEKYLPIYQMATQDRNTKLFALSTADAQAVPDEDMEKFCYIEHKINVALALAVCRDIGVKREDALQGMWSAIPDPGALSAQSIQEAGRTLTLVNAFAANDAESTLPSWKRFSAHHGSETRLVALVNCRNDRQQRSEHLAEAMGRWPHLNECFVIGTGTEYFIKTFRKLYAKHPVKIENYQRTTVSKLIQGLTQNYSEQPLVLVGIGNIKGIGLELLEYFQINKVEI